MQTFLRKAHFSSMPDISPSKEAESDLHDQGIWGKCKNIVDPEASKAAASTEAQNESAFDKGRRRMASWTPRSIL